MTKKLCHEDQDLMRDIVGVSNRIDYAKQRKRMMEYLYENHKEIVEEAYKATQWPEDVQED